MTVRESASSPDPGLAVDRTTLSWTRTALVAATLGALLLRTGLEHHSALTLGGATVALVDAVAVASIGRLRAASVPTRLAQQRSITPVLGIGVVAGLTAITVVLTSLAVLVG